jgi:hypothetical protein
LECFASCPVCIHDLRLCGPDGVMVHLLATHADSPEAHWVMKQLGVLVLARPADTKNLSRQSSATASATGLSRLDRPRHGNRGRQESAGP